MFQKTSNTSVIIQYLVALDVVFSLGIVVVDLYNSYKELRSENLHTSFIIPNEGSQSYALLYIVHACLTFGDFLAKVYILCALIENSFRRYKISVIASSSFVTFGSMISLFYLMITWDHPSYLFSSVSYVAIVFKVTLCWPLYEYLKSWQFEKDIWNSSNAQEMNIWTPMQ